MAPRWRHCHQPQVLSGCSGGCWWSVGFFRDGSELRRGKVWFKLVTAIDVTGEEDEKMSEWWRQLQVYSRILATIREEDAEVESAILTTAAV